MHFGRHDSGSGRYGEGEVTFGRLDRLPNWSQFRQVLIINYKFVSTMTVLGSLCLDGYFISSINSFFLSVGEVQQIPIMPASGARYLNMKGNK